MRGGPVSYPHRFEESSSSVVVEVEMEETRRTVPDAKTMFSLCNDGRIKEMLKGSRHLKI